MLNMPDEVGGRDLSMLGQVALEEEAGRCTNGLGFVVANRGPRELYEMATPEQVERFLAAGPPRRVPRGLGDHRARGGLRRRRSIQTTAVRDGDDWLLTGEKWFVTSQGEPGYYVVLAVAEGEQALFFVEPDAPGLRIKFTPGFLHDPYLDHHPEILFESCRVPERNRIPSGGNEGAKEWFTIERLFIAARCCGAAARSLELASDYAKERVQFGQPIAEFQGVSFQLADCLTELLAARLMTYHAAHAFDVEENRKIVHGKVAMAKLYASEMAGRVVDRCAAGVRRARLQDRQPGRAPLPRGARRPDLGGHERDPAPRDRPGPRQARRRPVRRLSPREPGGRAAFAVTPGMVEMPPPGVPRPGRRRLHTIAGPRRPALRRAFTRSGERGLRDGGRPPGPRHGSSQCPKRTSGSSGRASGAATRPSGP